MGRVDSYDVHAVFIQLAYEICITAVVCNRADNLRSLLDHCQILFSTYKFNEFRAKLKDCNSLFTYLCK